MSRTQVGGGGGGPGLPHRRGVLPGDQPEGQHGHHHATGHPLEGLNRDWFLTVLRLVFIIFFELKAKGRKEASKC